MFLETESHFVWNCESCDHYAAFKPHHFQDCVDELKERGWAFRLEEDSGSLERMCREWHHYCPQCRGKRWKKLFDQVPGGAKIREVK